MCVHACGVHPKRSNQNGERHKEKERQRTAAHARTCAVCTKDRSNQNRATKINSARKYRETER